MKSLKVTYIDIFYQNIDYELYEYNKALELLSLSNLPDLSEFQIPAGIKSKIDFFKEIASIIGKNVKDLIIVFKNTKVFKFFKAIHFSIKKILDLYKKGLSIYKNAEKILAKKIIEMGGVQYVRSHVEELQKFIDSHPVLKKIAGVSLAALLFYIWLNMSFTPDFEDSFDFSNILEALLGKFSLVHLFGTEAGALTLIYFATGSLLHVSFPWPGNTTRQVLTALVYTLYKQITHKSLTF